MKALHHYIIYKVEDKTFTKRIEKILKKNISNCDFSVDDFCKLAFMSRSCLHRNIKKITGYSTTELIREYRIRAAAEILEYSSGSISKISQKVGFDDYSYFSKCFKDIMYMSPSEYIEFKKKQRANRIIGHHNATMGVSLAC